MTITPSALPFSRIFRFSFPDLFTIFNFDLCNILSAAGAGRETIVKVLQPGPLGIIEHKYTAKEMERAASTVRRAVENWQRTAFIERNRRP
ncbi:UNVERIFIED_CONTAM: hypothetical protein Sradi_1412000 [Sesamum radiatum]|uniref:Uncharacterized protein n=1 Tax=Sesamum radiatum TaxID=300843 RepID=A0AAW2UUS4_SESRA